MKRPTLSPTVNKMQDFIEEHKEFIDACLAIFLGSVIGFASVKLITKQMNSKVLETCKSAKIIAINDPLIGDRFFCINK